MNGHASKVYPHCQAFERRIEIGGLTKAQLLEEFRKHSIQMNEQGHRLFEESRFVVSTQRYAIKTVELSVADLGFPEGAISEEVYQRAAKMGLGVCPLELGPFMRLQFMNQPEGARLTLSSQRLSQETDVPSGFYLRRLGEVLWLRGYTCSLDWVCPADEHFVFSKKD
jgi:hypothetical protein